MITSSKICIALVLAACAMPAFAQDQQKAEKIVLEQKMGSVMTSTGGDYESAKPGQQLVVNESMMLTDGAKATVVYFYDGGKRKCTEVYKGPNTFVIDGHCAAAAGYAAGNAGNAGRSAAIIAGAALIAAAIIGNDTVDYVPPPVSGSSR
jgi:hypothetical protein